MGKEDFHTFSAEMKRLDKPLTASMEDYLEMICRLSAPAGYTRINELAGRLNIKPPAATKMVQRLAGLSLLDYKKYGVIELSRAGLQMGQALLARHKMVEKFLALIGVPQEELLAETERMEHTVSENTLKCFSRFVRCCEKNPGWIELLQRENREK